MLSVWTLDIGFGFVKGVYRRGELVLGFRAEVSHYLRTLFLVDLANVPSDWMSVALHYAKAARQSTAAIGFLQLSRVSRLLRWQRVARIMRVPEFVDRLVARVGARAL